jgi:hypothetical protein
VAKNIMDAMINMDACTSRSRMPSFLQVRKVCRSRSGVSDKVFFYKNSCQALFVLDAPHARLARPLGYFYFRFGEAADWLDKTVKVPTLIGLTLQQWLAEFERLKKANAQIMGAGKAKRKSKR